MSQHHFFTSQRRNCPWKLLGKKCLTQKLYLVNSPRLCTDISNLHLPRHTINSAGTMRALFKPAQVVWSEHSCFSWKSVHFFRVSSWGELTRIGPMVTNVPLALPPPHCTTLRHLFYLAEPLTFWIHQTWWHILQGQCYIWDLSKNEV